MNNPISTTADTWKHGVSLFATDAAKATKDQVITPAVEAARSVAGYTSDAMEKAKEQIGHQIHQADEFTSQRLDQTSRWISTNPLSGVGVGFVLGVLATTFFGSSRR